MSTPEENRSCSPCQSGWRLPLLLAIVLVAIVFTQTRDFRRLVSERPTPPPNPEAADDSAPQVLLTINFGDGRWRNQTADWREGMTVADVLQQEPEISLASEGEGDGRFLTALAGVANHGSGGRNWTYSVNGKFADRSFAVYELRPNDHVLWTFADQP